MANKLTVVVAAAALLVLAASAAGARGLTVGNGAEWRLNANAMDMNCADVDLKPGGGLAAGTGVISDARHITIAAGATLDGGSATIALSGTWTNNGRFILGDSKVVFFEGCGVVNDVQGSGDSDGDGISDGEEGLGDRDRDGIPDFLDPAEPFPVPALGPTGMAVAAVALVLIGLLFLRRRRKGRYWI